MVASRADIIRQGSWRSVPFLWRESDTTGGQRVAKHVYPKRDKPYGEPMGRKEDGFDLVVFVNGDDWQVQRDALIRACRQGGPGRLVHPNFGEIDVLLTDYRCQESTDKLGEASFTLSFFESGDISFSSTVVFARGVKTMSAALTLKQRLQAWFASVYKSTGLSDFVGQSAIGDLKAVYGQVQSAVGQVRAASDALLGFEAQASFLQNAPLLALGAPVDLAGTIASVTESLSFLGNLGTLGSWSALFAALSGVSASDLGDVTDAQLSLAQTGLDDVPSVITPPPAIAADTPDRLQQAANSDAIFTLVRQSALAEAAQAAVATPFVSQQDATAVRDTIAAAIDDETLTTTDDGVFQALTDLRIAMSQEITATSIDLPNLITFTPQQTMPAVVLSHLLYDDPTLADDIVARNDIRHPGFVPGGRPIQVLSDVS